MKALRQRSQLRRIVRQTITLTKKNFLIFWKAPISTALRALIFPIAVTLVFCLLRNVGGSSYSGPDNPTYGIAASPFPIKGLSDAITSASAKRIVFVRNGVPDVDTAISGIVSDIGSADHHVVDDPNDLFDLCKQSLDGTSDCFAAVLFESSNATTIEYSIALDSSLVREYGYGDWSVGGSNRISDRILPLQWAVTSHLGGFSTIPAPQTQPRGGESRRTSIYSSSGDGHGNFWLFMISLFVAPVYILILIGIVYHLAIFVATERETQTSELMAAQKVSITPRILSTCFSFFVLYLPGVLISSILQTQLFFTRTSDILLLFCTILAAMSIVTSGHFLASFFGKAQLAGLYSSTLVFALALVTLAVSLAAASPEKKTIALAAMFPPITYVTLIGDVAFREYNLRGFSLAHNITNIVHPGSHYSEKNQAMDGYLYVVFFILQIIVYFIATYGIEQGLWGVTREYSTIESSSDVAVRCTNLSKTYYGKRRWYFPFSKKSGPVKAIDSLNLEVKRGSVTFLLGPNGGGKTTALKGISGMIALDNGSQLELNEAGQVFGICPQNNVFWDNLTVYEHIKIWRELKTAAFEDFGTGYQDDDVVAECDLIEKINAPAGTLSGGQMRKLQLAISFAGGSRVCCIDEASSGLDPLSRRNIWNIIQKGQSRRSILVTTHFLDEADVLADHIAIVYKGKLVCEGAPTSLKARFGDNYVIRANDEEESDSVIFKASNSADATRKIVELESVNKDQTYNVVFPTLEQVFLKVTDSKNSAIRGDGMVEEKCAAAAVVVEEKDIDGEHVHTADISLDFGQSIGFFKQVKALLNKRYDLLTQKAGWISYGINLIIPIIVAAALVKFVHKFNPYQTCAMNAIRLRNASFEDVYRSPTTLPIYAPFYSGNRYQLYSAEDSPTTLLGPVSEFSGSAQEDLYIQDVGTFMYSSYSYSSSSDSNPLNVTAARNRTLSSRSLVATSDEMIRALANLSTSSDYHRTPPLAIFAPTPESAILFYSTEQYETDLQRTMLGMDYLTNRIANSSTKTGSAKQVVSNLRGMRHAENESGFFLMPISILIVLAFIACASTSVIYPTFEKTNRVRALQYCNGVSPAALWAAYLLFDMQLIITQSIFVWALIFAGRVAAVWYSPSYLLGAFILFGMSTYLGCYVISLFLKKAAFAIAAGVHCLLVIIYLVSYVGADEVGGPAQFPTFDALQYGLALSSPGANLLRALFIATNSYGILCGKFGDADTSNAFAYVRYGSVYTNFILQILFLIAVLAIYEYGSADYIRRKILHRGMPPQLQYLTEDPNTTAGKIVTKPSTNILEVSQLTKYFQKLVAVENVSFSIPPNSTLALLGGNGAGKSTVINMVRSLLTPNFGSITLDNINVLAEPRKSRLHMGVCPQDDAIDNLTVRQTLTFYATVKGLADVVGNVDKVMQALNITTFEHHSVRALSGGTRRKLSVAIALLGNPRILLLDEPSTGQDAGAKRILWKALKSVSDGRAILLTTHSMEEAEALASHVAILGTKMLATGNLSSLQESHGGAYMIRAVRLPHTTSEQVKQLVEERFGYKVSNYLDGYGQVSFNLPHDKKALGSIMKGMEALNGEVLSDYTINGPTLEEVFMNVAREAGAVTGV